MDYDQSGIASTYDEARALTPARRRRWERLLSAHVDPADISLVLDLGCGTGRFSEMLAAELRAPVIGLDPSEKMIDQARRKSAASPVVFGRASAHELPLPEGCVDLVFMSLIYHHLRDPPAAVRECRRVLSVGGYVCIRTGTRENDVVVPDFFPAVRAMLNADLPSRGEISSNFAAAGFTPKHHEIVTEVVAPDWPSFVRKSALRGDSFLARLYDRVGMALTRRDLTRRAWKRDYKQWHLNPGKGQSHPRGGGSLLRTRLSTIWEVTGKPLPVKFAVFQLLSPQICSLLKFFLALTKLTIFCCLLLAKFLEKRPLVKNASVLVKNVS